MVDECKISSFSCQKTTTTEWSEGYCKWASMPECTERQTDDDASCAVKGLIAAKVDLLEEANAAYENSVEKGAPQRFITTYKTYHSETERNEPEPCTLLGIWNCNKVHISDREESYTLTVSVECGSAVEVEDEYVFPELSSQKIGEAAYFRYSVFDTMDIMKIGAKLQDIAWYDGDPSSISEEDINSYGTTPSQRVFNEDDYLIPKRDEEGEVVKDDKGQIEYIPNMRIRAKQVVKSALRLYLGELIDHEECEEIVTMLINRPDLKAYDKKIIFDNLNTVLDIYQDKSGDLMAFSTIAFLTEGPSIGIAYEGGNNEGTIVSSEIF